MISLAILGASFLESYCPHFHSHRGHHVCILVIKKEKLSSEAPIRISLAAKLNLKIKNS